MLCVIFLYFALCNNLALDRKACNSFDYTFSLNFRLKLKMDLNNFSSEQTGFSSFTKKKKKKTFMQKAKKFGKSGRYGKGKEIDRETYDYFLRVLEQLNRGFESDEEMKDVFVINVFETTLNEEVSLCSNQLVSRVLERLIPLASEKIQFRFMQVLADDLRIVAVDPFASHVLETLLLLATFVKSKASSADELQSEVTYRRNWVVRVSKFMINNFEEFSQNIYASHLLRTCFQCLAGIRLDANVTRSRKSRDQQTTTNTQGVGSTNIDSNESQIFSELEKVNLFEPLILAVNKILASNVVEMVSVDTSSAVIQALVLVLGKSNNMDECKKLCGHVFENVYKGNLLVTIKEEEEESTPTDPNNILHYESCCRLLETIIIASEKIPKIQRKVQKILQKNILDWALHPVGNFALQKFLATCDDKEIIEKWYETTFDNNLEEIFAAGNSGVVLAMAQTLRRLQVKQAHFLVALMKSLHCFDPPQNQLKFGTLLVYLSTKESYEEASQDSESSKQISVNLHGTLIIQELLYFNKPIKIVNSILDIDSNNLKTLLCDPRGCHITDAFMNSSTIGEKSRDSLIKQLQGHLVSMGCSKHGSRTIDKLWERASEKGRELIACELSAQLPLLTSNNFGKFIAQNLCLSTYKRSKDEWKMYLKKQQKQKDMAKDFLSDISGGKRKNSEQHGQENKKQKFETDIDSKSDIGFVVDKTGDVATELSQECMTNTDSKTLKKKKEKAKSYLDDL